MNATYINDGRATTIWNGISAAKFMRRCAQADEDEAMAMGLVASLMHSGEPITEDEFHAARSALCAVEKHLIDKFSGEIKYNRHGQPFGGTHPALV